MKYSISPDRHTLTLSVDEKERAELKEWRDDESREWGTPSAECEALEQLTANSELEWVDPCDTGDLTSAPMIGIVGGDEATLSEGDPLPEGAVGKVHVGSWGTGPFGLTDVSNKYAPVLERWAFMDYQLRTFMDDLMDKGEAVFVDRN